MLYISLIFLHKKFIALAWTNGKNKVDCTSEGQQLLIIVKIYKSIYILGIILECITTACFVRESLRHHCIAA